jgi:hypothetical protein
LRFVHEEGRTGDREREKDGGEGHTGANTDLASKLHLPFRGLRGIRAPRYRKVSLKRWQTLRLNSVSFFDLLNLDRYTHRQTRATQECEAECRVVKIARSGDS